MLAFCGRILVLDRVYVFGLHDTNPWLQLRLPSTGMSCRSLTLLFALLSLLASGCASVSQAPVSGQSLKIGEHQLLLHSFEGVPRWQLVPHLWESSWVNITCQGLQVVLPLVTC